MTHLIFAGILLVAGALGFGSGYLIASTVCERKYERELQRKVRPAHIHIEKHNTIHEFTVQPGALDVNYPNTEEFV